MYIFWIVLGLLCLPFAVNSPIFILLAVIFIGCGLAARDKKIKKEKRKKDPQKGDAAWTGRFAGDSYVGVRDENGDLLNVSGGGFTEGADGLFRDGAGHVVGQDSDGEYHLY